MKRKKHGLRFRLIVALAAVWLASFALSKDGLAQEKPETRVVIGAILDLTGEGAARGRHARDALLLEESRFNENKGAADARMHLVTIDSEGKARIAAEAVGRLAGEFGAVAIVGPPGREEALAAAREADDKRIPLVALSAPEGILTPLKKWVFSAAHRAEAAARLSFSHIRSRGFEKIAVLTSGDAMGREGREALSSLAPRLGLSIFLNHQFSDKEHNFLPFLQKANRRGVQAFLHWSDGASRLALARARQALDLKMPIYLSTMVSRRYSNEKLSRATEGLIIPVPRLFAVKLFSKNAPDWRAAHEFRADFLRRFGQTPDGLAGYAADAFRLITRSLKGTNTSRGKVRRKIETTSPYVGLTGTYRFSESDHNGLKSTSLVMIQIKNGKWALARKINR